MSSRPRRVVKLVSKILSAAATASSAYMLYNLLTVPWTYPIFNLITITLFTALLIFGILGLLW